MTNYGRKPFHNFKTPKQPPTTSENIGRSTFTISPAEQINQFNRHLPNQTRQSLNRHWWQLKRGRNTTRKVGIKLVQYLHQGYLV